jgi:hypothetical protein
MNTLLKGIAFALAGAAAGGGAKTPGAGAAAGLQTGIGLSEQAFQNQQEAAKNASAIRFQNVQAAEATARAAMYDKQLHEMDTKFQDEHNANTLNQMKDLQALGITPTIMTDNHGHGANAALEQLTASHGGVPHMFILNLGDKLVGYDLGSMANGSTSVDLVNKINGVQGKQPLTPGMWAQMSPEAKNGMLSQALNFWNPMPTKENVGTLVQQYQNYKDTYAMRPDADPEIVSKLEKTVSFLNRAKDQFVTDKATEAGAVKKAEIAADPLGQAEKKTAIVKNQVETAKSAEELKLMREMGGLTDPFGMPVGRTPSGMTMNRKELDASQKTFNKDYVEPLNKLSKTRAEFDRINNNPNQSGAERVTALLAAVGISGDALKGQGFRISKDVIDEHAEARNAYQGFVQKWNKVADQGGPITSKQIADYTSIAEGVVHDAYVNAAQEARRQGLPVDFLPKGQGKAIDPMTAKIYLEVAGGDVQAAHKAIVHAGYAP